MKLLPFSKVFSIAELRQVREVLNREFRVRDIDVDRNEKIRPRTRAEGKANITVISTHPYFTTKIGVCI